MSRRSIFERLTGGGDNDENIEVHNETERAQVEHYGVSSGIGIGIESEIPEEEEFSSELSVDVYQTDEYIVVEAHIAGMKAEDLDVSITREMVTIKGDRKRSPQVDEDQYYAQELYWGKFSRTILLPQEVEAAKADAKMDNGIIKITLPRINKDKIHKLRIKG